MARANGSAVAKRVLATRTQMLKVPLTEVELREVAEQTYRVEGDLRDFYGHKKEVTSELKAKEEELDAKLARLGRLGRDKHEYRPVPVRIEADYKAGKVYEIREDTGEVVAERAVNEQDRQAPLFAAQPVDALVGTREEAIERHRAGQAAEKCGACGLPADAPSSSCDECDHGRARTADQRKAAERAKVERQADELLKNAGAGELAKKELKGDAVARKAARR